MSRVVSEKMGAAPLAGKGWENFLLIEESFGTNEVEFRLSEVNSAIAPAFSQLALLT